MSGARVLLEVGDKRVFAAALDWPGWCRAGRDEDGALETLAGYAERYRPVADAAGVQPPPDAGRDFDVVERAEGTASTDFGAPDAIAEDDLRPVGAEEAAGFAAILDAAWRLLEGVAATAPPDLVKGPRGGGRDRDAVVAHVAGAEFSYARNIGVRHPGSGVDDPEAIAALRRDVLAVLARPSDGGPIGGAGPRGGKRWPQRYAARRFTWHVLDHAWEIQDRIPPT